MSRINLGHRLSTIGAYEYTVIWMLVDASFAVMHFQNGVYIIKSFFGNNGRVGIFFLILLNGIISVWSEVMFQIVGSIVFLHKTVAGIFFILQNTFNRIGVP